MQFQDVWLLLAFFVLVLAPAPFLGRYLYRVMEGQKTLLTPLLQPVERLCYRLGGVDERAEQSWKTYALALLAFTAVSVRDKSSSTQENMKQKNAATPMPLAISGMKMRMKKRGKE